MPGLFFFLPVCNQFPNLVNCVKKQMINKVLGIKKHYMYWAQVLNRCTCRKELDKRDISALFGGVSIYKNKFLNSCSVLKSLLSKILVLVKSTVYIGLSGTRWIYMFL